MQTRIGKFELKRLLGTGASGKVYHALDTYAGREVALKVIDRQVLSEAEAGEQTRGQFLNESALAGKLAHPHIVSILEAVMGEDSGYVAMEYVPGDNLVKFTRPDSLLPLDDVIQIGFKSCGALDYAFRQGIVHRDIKPANILRVNGSNIKIADFGAALLKSVKSNKDMLVGTPSYMSPEQIDGAQLTLHNDMYALGVVLYELLTGGRPFTAATLNDLFHKITHEDPVPPSVMQPSLTSKLDPVILRALSKRPEDRYPTWADFALEIAQVGKLGIQKREISDSDKFGFLRKSDLFQKLNDAQIWELVHASRWSRIPAGNAIIRENEPGHSLYLLAQGQVTVTKRERLLNVLKAGDCFGEMAYIQGGVDPRHATIQSVTEVLIVEFDNAALAHMSESCQLQFSRGLLRTLVERLSLADARITQVS